jgi:hypothetical protein
VKNYSAERMADRERYRGGRHKVRTENVTRKEETKGRKNEGE